METLVKRPDAYSFAHTYKNTPKQAVENLASTSLETRRIPDPYYFLIDADGDLFSPSSNCKVKTIIRKDHMVGQLEAKAFDTITDWAREAADGSIAWISPPYSGIYPTSKIIISEIEKIDGVKKVFNRAIVLDLDEEQCLRFGRSLSGFALNEPILTDSDSLRTKPLVFCRSALELMGELLEDVDFLELIKRGEDKQAKFEALIEAERILSQSYSRFTFNQFPLEKEISAMMGPNSSSCPVNLTGSSYFGSAFQVFFQNSLEIKAGISSFESLFKKSEWYCEKCPVCGAVIQCEVRPGAKCPECPAVRECA